MRASRASQLAVMDVMMDFPGAGACAPPSARGTDALWGAASPASAAVGAGVSTTASSGRSAKDVNLDDPVEVAMAGRLQQSAMTHVAESTSASYVGQWIAFVSRWWPLPLCLG